jgi:hypothetical protein
MVTTHGLPLMKNLTPMIPAVGPVMSVPVTNMSVIRDGHSAAVAIEEMK